MFCNLCGSNRFIELNGRQAVRCATCNSVERSRLLWMYLEKFGALTPATRVLHVAPERCIYEKISAVVDRENYHVRDFNPAGYAFAKDVIESIDLCDLGHLPSNYYDVIIHSHVLEHVCCNIAHPLFHLHRALKPEGGHFVVVPFLSGRYDECFQEIGSAERVRRFGQDDHLRRFGIDDVDAHLGKLIQISDGSTRELLSGFTSEVLEASNIPPFALRSLTPHTVLYLRKADMHLIAQ